MEMKYQKIKKQEKTKTKNKKREKYLEEKSSELYLNSGSFLNSRSKDILITLTIKRHSHNSCILNGP